MADQKPSTCPACGVDLRYPNALHVVDCPAPAADQTPIVETDVIRECATEMYTCLSDGPAAFDAWLEAQDKLTTDRIDGSWQDAIFKLGDAMAGTQAWDAYDAERRRGYMEALADLTRHMEAARG